MGSLPHVMGVFESLKKKTPFNGNNGEFLQTTVSCYDVIRLFFWENRLNSLFA